MTQLASSPPVRPRRRFARIAIERTLLAVSALVCLGLLSSRLWPVEWIGCGGVRGAGTWLAFMGRTFAFHGAVATVVVGGLGLMMGKRLPIVLAVASVALAWPEVRVLWPRSAPEATATSPHLRVMSMNLLFTNREREAVLRAIEREDPDVILLQEYHLGWDAALRARLAARYPFACTPLEGGMFGQAVYSKRAWTREPEMLRLTGADYCPQIGVTFDVGGRALTIWNVHTASPSSAMAITRQREQVERLGELSSRGGALVIMGDFNSTPASWNADLMRARGFTEANAAVGAGRGATWPDVTPLRYLPGVRIDNAWGKGVAWRSSKVVEERTGSDHRAIVVEVGVE